MLFVRDCLLIAFWLGSCIGQSCLPLPFCGLTRAFNSIRIGGNEIRLKISIYFILILLQASLSVSVLKQTRAYDS